MVASKDDKNNKIIEIKSHIHNFCEKKLNSELEGYCYRLCETLGRKRKINMLRSISEQWAASIIYVIARLNYLFDQENEYFITADDICNFFNTKKSTTGNKATQIEKLCNLSMGAEDYCSEDIRDSFTFYETESGLIIPKSMINEFQKEYLLKDDEAPVEQKILINNEEKIQKQREMEKQKKLTTQKNRKSQHNVNKDQLDLFDD
jgi:hypothetical protein